MWQLYNLLLLSVVVGMCDAHGRLIDPPSRASAWRFGWGTPIDYNDNEGFCGGFNYQYNIQGGKCGICGDAWDEDPRPHEAGGKYATGTIVRQYSEGQVIPVKVDVTSNHRGHFEFRICPNNNPKVEASQTCLNEHPLFLAEGGFQYELPRYNGEHVLHLQLPKNLTCTQCVFQWRYVAGNNWGTCEDGTGNVGCGPQEEFRACADVAISAQPTWSSNGFTEATESKTKISSSVGKVTSSYSWYSTPEPDVKPTLSPTLRPPPPSTSRTEPPRGTTTSRRTSVRRTTILPRRTTTAPSSSRRPRPRTTTTTTPFPSSSSSRRPRPRTTTLEPVSSQPPTTPRPELIRSTEEPELSSLCRSVGVWKAVPGMDEWCFRNCLHTPPFCPSSHCTCD